MKNVSIKALGLLFSVSMLSGCASLGANTEKDFLCEAQIGTPCATISTIDGSSGPKVIPVTQSEEDKALATLSSTGLSEKESAGMNNVGFGSQAYHADRYRVEETLGRLWIAPYLDENQILHEARYVHFVLTDARWVSR